MQLVQEWADETQHIFQPPMPDRRALMQLAMGQGQEMLALELYVSKPCMSIVRLYRGAANKAQINDDTLSFEVATLPGGVGSLRPSLEMDTGQLRLHFMTLERGLIPEVEWGGGQLALFFAHGLHWPEGDGPHGATNLPPRDVT